MRVTPWTPEQLEAIKQLREDDRIENERPCGCFDVVIDREFTEGFRSIQIVFCDTCRAGLIAWRPEIFGNMKES